MFAEVRPGTEADEAGGDQADTRRGTGTDEADQGAVYGGGGGGLEMALIRHGDWGGFAILSEAQVAKFLLGM